MDLLKPSECFLNNIRRADGISVPPQMAEWSPYNSKFQLPSIACLFLSYLLPCLLLHRCVCASATGSNLQVNDSPLTSWSRLFAVTRPMVASTAQERYKVQEDQPYKFYNPRGHCYSHLTTGRYGHRWCLIANRMTIAGRRLRQRDVLQRCAREASSLTASLHSNHHRIRRLIGLVGSP